MTREEAIAYGKRVIDLGLKDETQAFCELAIKALEQEPKPMVEIDLYSVVKQKYIEREVLDKIRTEIEKEINKDDHADEYCDGYYDGMRNALAIIDKYKAESENKK